MCLRTKTFLIAVGDTYSCFTDFQTVVTDGCKSRTVDDDGAIVQATLSDVENSDFCVSGPSYGQAKQGLSPIDNLGLCLFHFTAELK